MTVANSASATRPIAQLASEIGSARDWRGMCRTILQFSSSVSPADTILLCLYNEPESRRQLVYGGMYVDGVLEEPSIDSVPLLPLNSAPQSQAIRNRAMVYTADFAHMAKGVESPKFGLRRDALQNPPGSSVAVPLMVDGSVLGVMELQSRSAHAFGPEHLDMLQLAASLAAIAAHNIRLVDEVTASERRYLSLLRNSSDTTLLADVEGTTLWIGGAVERYTGFSPDELVGENAFAFIHPDEQAAVREGFVEAVELGRGPRVTFRFRRKDGTWRWKESVATNLLDDPAVGAVVVNSRDITERIEAEQAIAHEREVTDAAIRSVPGLFYMFDEAGRYIRWNQNLQDLVGRTDAEMLDANPLDLVLERDEVGTAIGKVLEHGSAAIEAHILRQDGTPILHALTGERVMVDGRPHVLGIGIDISERERAQREQDRLVTDLAERVKELRLLHETSQLLVDEARPLQELFDDLVTRIPRAFRAPERTKALIRFGDVEAATSEFVDDPAMIDARFETRDGDPVEVRVGMSPASDADAEARFLDEERALIASVSQMLAAYLDRRRAAEKNFELTHRLKKQLSHLAALKRVDASITSSADLDLTLDVILDQVTEVLDVDAADILLFDRDTQTLRLRAGKGLFSHAVRTPSFRLGESWPGRAALERKPVFIPNLGTATMDDTRLAALREEGFQGVYKLPLIAKGELQGVLGVFGRKPLSTDRDWHEIAQAMAVQAALAIHAARMFEGLQSSNVELQLAYDRTIEGWARALDLKDEETAGHSQRVTELTVELARRMGVTGDELANIRRGALLHDIGKMGVPDRVLLKPGKLDEDEWEIMKRHTTHARDLLKGIPFLERVLDIPYAHHEKFDGSGYPRGIAGETIPLAARIFAVVDVFDALTSDRPYRKAWAFEETLAHIAAESGAHFDPVVVDAFLAMIADHGEVRI